MELNKEKQTESEEELLKETKENEPNELKDAEKPKAIEEPVEEIEEIISEEVKQVI